jgi:hypothetical protein
VITREVCPTQPLALLIANAGAGSGTGGTGDGSGAGSGLGGSGSGAGIGLGRTSGPPAVGVVISIIPSQNVTPSLLSAPRTELRLLNAFAKGSLTGRWV